MQTPSNLSHFRKYPQHISVLKHFISDFGQTSPKAYFFFLHSGTCLSFFFFAYGPLLKYLLNLLNIASILCFGFFGHEVCRILAPWPEIEPTLLSLEGRVLTSGLLGKSLAHILIRQTEYFQLSPFQVPLPHWNGSAWYLKLIKMSELCCNKE